MTELQQQLAALRARMARVLEECAEKYENPGTADPSSPTYTSAETVQHADDFSADNTPTSVKLGAARREAWIREARAAAHKQAEERRAANAAATRYHVDEWLPGAETETEHGKHYESETFYPSHRPHGSADVGALSELPADLLETISGGAVRGVNPQEWVFLDTETTGLSGGTGTCAFLVGVGRITPDGFRVKQFFMRDYGEEVSLLHALAQHLEPFRVLITYNGRTFDQPLLETRYRMNRARPPFSRMEHLDLLHGTRRLWKLRFESCRLVELERRVLGFERRGDIAGSMIPYVYFEYLRSGEMARLLPVFHHNALDILTLACLTGIVPHAFNSPVSGNFKHGAEKAALARWLRDEGELEQARDLFRNAIEAGLPDQLLFRTLWDVAAIERKLGCNEAAVADWGDLAEFKNAFQVKALEELAKHHEHHSKLYAIALDFTQKALILEDSAGLQKRQQRLAKKLAANKVT